MADSGTVCKQGVHRDKQQQNTIPTLVDVALEARTSRVIVIGSASGGHTDEHNHAGYDNTQCLLILYVLAGGGCTCLGIVMYNFEPCRSVRSLPGNVVAMKWHSAETTSSSYHHSANAWTVQVEPPGWFKLVAMAQPDANRTDNTSASKPFDKHAGTKKHTLGEEEVDLSRRHSCGQSMTSSQRRKYTLTHPSRSR